MEVSDGNIKLLRGTQRNENLHGKINAIVKIRVGERLSENVLRGHRFLWNFKHLRHPWVKGELSIDPECIRVSNLDMLRNLERTSQLLEQPLALNVTNGIVFARPYTKLLDSNPNPRHAAMLHYKKGSSHQSRGLRTTKGSANSQSSLPPRAPTLSLSGVNTSGGGLSTMQLSITGSGSSQSSLPPNDVSSLSGVQAFSTSSTSSAHAFSTSDLSAVRSPDVLVQNEAISDNLLPHGESVINSRKRKQWNNDLDDHLRQASHDTAMHDGNFDWVAIHQLFCAKSQVYFSKTEVKNRGNQILRNKPSSMAINNIPSFPVASHFPVASAATHVTSSPSFPVASAAFALSSNNHSANLEETKTQAHVFASNQQHASSNQPVNSSVHSPALTQPSFTSVPRRNALQPTTSSSVEQINQVILAIPPKRTAFTSAEMEILHFLTSNEQIKKVSNLGSGIKWPEFHRQYIYRCKRMQLEDKLQVYNRSLEQLQQKYKDMKN